VDPLVHIEREQMCCYLTRTTPTTHKMITDNLHETPTYGGWVEAKGPRYCPSIEDKVTTSLPSWTFASILVSKSIACKSRFG
jgi:tRNA U34 5-carboxymethylaminomethyl modifying enzyme MnmG/GidA